MKKIGYSLWTVLVLLLVVVSCQREVEVTDFGTPASGADSTQLIKAITLHYYDINGQPDSATETFTYDTIQRIITTTLASGTGALRDSVSYQYFYNADHSLTEIRCLYPAGYVPVDGDMINTSIAYDNAQVLKQVVLNYTGWGARTYNYTKLSTDTGYYLVCEIPLLPASTGITYRYTSFFDNQGRCLQSRNDMLIRDTNGELTDFSYQYIDSLVYTPAGELQKVYRQYNAIPGPPPPQLLYYEFGERYDKGDQLAKLKRVLFRGIDNVPFDASNQDWPITSLLNAFYDSYAANQFVHFPCKTSSFDNGISVENTVHTATFDQLGRLVTFTGSLYAGVAPEDETWKVMYYK